MWSHITIPGSHTPYKNRREANSPTGIWPWKVCPQRSPGHFSTVPLPQATLDENITPKRGPMFLGRQTVMQTPRSPLPALQLCCALPPKPPRSRDWGPGITYHHLVPSNEVWGLTEELHVWHCHCTGLLTHQNRVVQFGIASCHRWDQIPALHRKENHTPK